MQSEAAKSSSGKVAQRKQNCWMVTTARTAMRSTLVPQLPKPKPLAWVLKNKLNVLAGRRIDFDKYIDYSQVQPTPHVQRTSNLESKDKAKLVRDRVGPDQRYPLKVFQNR